MNLKKYRAKKFSGSTSNDVEDTISVEVPLSISINNIPFTVTMQTPGAEKQLVHGLLFTEGVCNESNLQIDFRGRDSQNNVESLNVKISQEKLLRDFVGMRNVISTSSCGICGIASLEPNSKDKIKNDKILNPLLVEAMFKKVQEHQEHFQKSGGTHASAVFNDAGELMFVHEDIGRHNAVDKAIGELLISEKLKEANCITVSGRISFEIVKKVHKAGIPFLAAVSAPSSLAIDAANEFGITLMAFCRGEGFTVYTNLNKVATN